MVSPPGHKYPHCEHRATDNPTPVASSILFDNPYPNAQRAIDSGEAVETCAASCDGKAMEGTTPALKNESPPLHLVSATMREGKERKKGGTDDEVGKLGVLLYFPPTSIRYCGPIRRFVFPVPPLSLTRDGEPHVQRLLLELSEKSSYTHMYEYNGSFSGAKTNPHVRVQRTRQGSDGNARKNVALHWCRRASEIHPAHDHILPVLMFHPPVFTPVALSVLYSQLHPWPASIVMTRSKNTR